MTTVTITRTAELEKFLGFAACIIRNQGYVSGKDAREKGIESTGELAWEWATIGRPDSLRVVMLLPEDKATGKVVAEWLKNIETKGNDYLEHLFAVGVAGVVTEKFIGYAASAIQAMEREQKKARESDPKNPVNSDKFLGTVGGKISVKAIYVGTQEFDSRYGRCFKHIFSDGTRTLVWLTSTKLELFKQGDLLNLSGTVKKHSTYGKDSQTEIKNARMVKV